MTTTVYRGQAARAFRRAWLNHADATRPIDRRLTWAALQGMAELQAEIDGRWTPVAYITAVQDAVRAMPSRTVAHPTSSVAERNDATMWVERLDQEIADRLEKLGRGELP